MGLINALNTGRTAMLSNQKAIEVTGNNISNVNTPGYSRQSAVFSDYPTLSNNGYVVGRGAKIDTVERAHDQFLSRQVQEKNAALGEEEGKATSLAELERVVNINDERGLARIIDDFFISWQDLSADPGSRVARDQVIQNGEVLAETFGDVINDLEDLRNNMNTDLTSRVGDLNQKFAEIASINSRIATVEATGQEDLADRDRRDVLLEEIAYTMGGNFIENENGMVSVFLPGGLPVVDGSRSFELETQQKIGDLELRLKIGSRWASISPDNIGGELKGFLTLRDEVIPGVMSEVDKLAYNLASEVNRIHSAGQDSSGANRDFFVPLTAEDGAARALAVNITSYTQVAAGRSSATGDNENALLLSALGRDRVMDGDETFVGYYGRIAGDVGVQVRRNDLAVAGSQDALDQVQNLRDGTIGVSLEEEMVALIQYQNSFEASARFLTTVDQLMDTLIGIKA